MGQAESAAAVLVLSGAKRKRFALPHARILLHQPRGGAEGQAVDVEIQAKEIVRNRELMNEIIAEHTGQPMESVSKDVVAEEQPAASRRGGGEGCLLFVASDLRGARSRTDRARARRHGRRLRPCSASTARGRGTPNRRDE